MNCKKSLFLLITASSFVLSTTAGYTVQYLDSENFARSGNERSKQDELIKAVEDGNFARVEDIILNDDTAITVRDRSQNSLLHIALQKGHEKIVHFLLYEKCDINSVNWYKSTPLHEAAIKGDKTMLELLLKKGARVNDQDKEGNTPFHIVVQNKHIDCILPLMEIKNFNSTIQNDQGITPIQLADEGDLNTITFLGILYYEGLGVARNPEKAFDYFSKAASYNPVAMMKKGICLMEGEGVTKDYENAKKCFEDAVKLGHMEANVYLGRLYEEGWGIKQDYAEALYMYQQEATRGSHEGLLRVGHMYHFGYGVKKDYIESMFWYVKAADKGNATAMSWIGHLYLSGQGVYQDYGKAMEWYVKAADKGDAIAMRCLGNLYLIGQGVHQDYGKAMEWYVKAADKGDTTAMYNVGYLYLIGQGVHREHPKPLGIEEIQEVPGK